MAICTYEQSLPCGYTENGKNQEFKSTKTSQTHCFGKLKRLASSTVLVYQNSSFSTVLALQKEVKNVLKLKKTSKKQHFSWGDKNPEAFSEYGV